MLRPFRRLHTSPMVGLDNPARATNADHTPRSSVPMSIRRRPFGPSLLCSKPAQSGGAGSGATIRRGTAQRPLFFLLMRGQATPSTAPPCACFKQHDVPPTLNPHRRHMGFGPSAATMAMPTARVLPSLPASLITLISKQDTAAPSWFLSDAVCPSADWAAGRIETAQARSLYPIRPASSTIFPLAAASCNQFLAKQNSA